MNTDEILRDGFKRSFKGQLQQNGNPISASNPLPVAAVIATDGNTVIAQNFTSKLRDAFQAWPNANWSSVIGAGDIVQVDGNAVGASYLVISKDPLTLNTNTSMTSVAQFGMPIEIAAGLHLSQRTVGQEFSFEVVSTETPSTFTELAISVVQQSTTTLTVTTVLPHNLRPGMRICTYGISDSRLNYPSLVVATISSATQFTVTAGPNGTIPSVTAGPFAQGFVMSRPAMGGSPNGTSIIFENATATNASFYAKSEGGDVMPIGGTINGNHSTTIGTTASVAALTTPLTYAWRPTNEFRLSLFAERLQWSDALIDSTAQSISRVQPTQVIPNTDQKYVVRIRAVNQPSLTIPVAQIVSAVKTGTTTATITTDVPHGLTVSDVVNIYGLRDQTNFPNLTAATAVVSVPNATSFTIVIGTASTNTSYGGFVSRVNGGQTQQGGVTMSVQSFSRTSNIITVVGSATWSGVSIGDYINLVGIRNSSTGASLGVDGAYRVRDSVTTSLILEPIGLTPTGLDITTTNCGGGVLKRTDFRISYTRLFDFERLRVEPLARPASDLASSFPTVIQGGSVNVATLSNGQTAHSSASTGFPVRIAGRIVPTTIATQETTLIAGDASDAGITTNQQLIVKENATSELDFNVPVTSLATTTTVQGLVQASGTASVRNYIKSIRVANDALGAAGNLLLLDSALTVSSIAITTGLATTSAAHDLRISDVVVFTALAGGTGVTANQLYYVTSVGSTTTFNFATAPGGANTVPTVAYTGTTMYRVFDQIRLQTTAGERTVTYSQPLKGIANTIMNFLIPTSLTSGNIYITVNGFRGF